MFKTILGISVVVVLALVGRTGFTNVKESEYEDWGNRPLEKFENPKEAFEKVKEALLNSYYEKGFTEEDIYRAAVKGMVENLDPKMANWNRLLSPTERKEVMSDVAGEIVGAGVEIKFDSASGMADILNVLPGSPADNAGIQSGDRLLSVNGKSYKGLDLRDVVYAIRGKVGQTRKLTLLREDKVISKKIELKKVPYENVSAEVLSGGVGLLGVRYFTENTPKKIREALESFKSKKVKALVVDLRGNQGGLFDQAVESAGFFLEKGKTVARVSRREGKEEVYTAKENAIVSGIPVAVLINEETSSGAEVFSAALKENIGATLVGTRTKGKWSVQKIEELSNHYAIKFTVGLMSSPSGNSYSGSGLSPDIEVAMSSTEILKSKSLRDEKNRVAADGQLRTAVGILKAKAG